MPEYDAGVRAENLVKRFDGEAALDGISFEIGADELFGFIGPDGAGKTTLFRILVSLLVPDEGRADVLGYDVVSQYREIRRRVGYMPGRFSLYGDLSVEENVRFFASVFGTTIDEQYDIIAPVYSQVEPFKHRRAADLSGGMKQKLALSCALVHRPDILILDEPTTGVDAVSRREFWDVLQELKTGGLPILVSTPYMDEASRCDRIALIQNGTILTTNTPSAIGEGYTKPLLAVRADDRFRLLQTLRTFPHAFAVFPFGEDLHYTDARPHMNPGDIVREVTNWLADAGFDDVQARPIAADVEDVFMAMMGDGEHYGVPDGEPGA